MAATSHTSHTSPRTPRLAPLSAALARPAFVALFVATGIAGYVLAYQIDSTAFSFCFGLALVLALVSTFTANFGGERIRFLAQCVRFITVPVLLLTTTVTNPDLFFARDFVSDSNTIIAGYVGLALVFCIILIGLPVEGRPVPIAMPLVAGLSLFGLLNLVIVDTIVQVGFLIFVAASLFLIGYEHLLSHWQRRGFANKDRGHEVRLKNAARAFLAASALWFAFFVTCAALLYQPLYAILPGVLPTPLGRLNRTQAQTDWRNSPTQVEVRGGNHVLSEREIMKVTLLSGQSSGLWRGRIYQNYIASSWQDDRPDPPGPFYQTDRQGFDSQKLLPDSETALPLFENLPKVAPSYGQAQRVRATIEPLSANNPTPLYGAGRVTSISADFQSVDINTHTGAVSMQWLLNRGGSPIYTTKSEYVAPKAEALLARAMTGIELQDWRSAPATKATIELPEDSLVRLPLEHIVQEIRASARAQKRKIDTPMQKALAISAYLHEHCVYSLRAPLAPSTADGVAYFLTTSRQGACDMFASSMTLLLRAMDVPARLATGYLEPDSNSSTTKEIVLREKDAHAWVEYWVPQLGWITHDPSAGTRVAADSWLTNTTQWLSGLLRGVGGTAVLLPLLGILLLGAGLFWPQVEKVLGRTPLTGDATSQQRARVSRAYAQATRLLRRHLKSKRRYDYAFLTPREFDDAISRADLPPAAKQEFAALTYLHAAAHYSSTPPDTSEAQLKASLERLKSALR